MDVNAGNHWSDLPKVSFLRLLPIELEVSVERREAPPNDTLAQILQQLEETKKENQQLKAKRFALEQWSKELRGSLERREQNLSPPTICIDQFLEG